MSRNFITILMAILAVLSLLMLSCTQKTKNHMAIEKSWGLAGISGMEKINERYYLTIYDLKSYEEGNRVSVIEVEPESGVRVHLVSINDWIHPDGAGSDLESVCKLPGRENEFLIAESGKWDGEYGRMFHIRLKEGVFPFKADVLGVFGIPEFDAKGPDDSAGDEIEGLACYHKGDNKLGVIFGERGGSDVYPQGLLRWAEADLLEYELSWTAEGKVGLSVNAPGDWVDGALNRDISGLHIDKENKLWAVSAEELGDNGPFSSIVYQVGMVFTQDPEPILVLDSLVVYKRMDGFKAEGISWGTGLIPGSRFSIGTEDEQLGGSWRVLN